MSDDRERSRLERTSIGLARCVMLIMGLGMPGAAIGGMFELRVVWGIGVAVMALGLLVCFAWVLVEGDVRRERAGLDKRWM